MKIGQEIARSYYMNENPAKMRKNRRVNSTYTWFSASTSNKQLEKIDNNCFFFINFLYFSFSTDKIYLFPCRPYIQDLCVSLNCALVSSSSFIIFAFSTFHFFQFFSLCCFITVLKLKFLFWCVFSLLF